MLLLYQVTEYFGFCTILRVLAFITYLVIVWSRKLLNCLSDDFNKWLELKIWIDYNLNFIRLKNVLLTNNKDFNKL